MRARGPQSSTTARRSGSPKTSSSGSGCDYEKPAQFAVAHVNLDGKRITLFAPPQFADEHQRRFQISGSGCRAGLSLPFHKI